MNRGFDKIQTRLFPSLTFVLALMLEAVLNQYPTPHILWCLLVLFYWSFFYPERLSPLLLISVGCFADLQSLAPLGLHVFLFLIFYLIVVCQQNMHYFPHIWILFGVISGIIIALEGSIVMYVLQIHFPTFIWKSWLTTFVSVPLFYFFVKKKIAHLSYG